MKEQPPIAQPLWDGMPAKAQAAVSELVDSYRRRIAELEQRLGRDSTNSLRPPYSDPPSLKRRPSAPPRARNGAASLGISVTSATRSRPRQSSRSSNAG